MTPQLEGALDIAALGVRTFRIWGVADGACRCPKGTTCESAGKHPVESGWQGIATTNQATIRRWAKDHPDDNFGALGDDLVTADIDPQNGGTLGSLPKPWPKTNWVVRTGGGGWHLCYLQNGHPVGNRKPQPGIDVKAKGGYVVCPGSLHASGRRYTWVSRPGSREVAVQWPELWPWGDEPSANGDRPRSKLADLLAHPPQTEGDRGGRNEWFAGVAGHLAKREHHEDAYRAELISINRSLHAPLAPDELDKVATSIWSRERTKVDPALNLPDVFWSERPPLAQIRDAAWSRQRSPDAVFHCVLSRVAATLPHQLRLPPIVGSAQPLCYFAVLMGDPGSGKSTTNAIAAELLPVSVHDVRPGSGEGLIEAYLDFVEEDAGKGKTKRVKRQVRHNAHIYVDEGAVLSAFSVRSGNTTLATMRSMWSGESVGQDNARDETKRRLPRGSYTLGMVVALQEELAEPLLSDAPAGTPQRFGWARTTDPSIPEPGSQPAWPGALGWSPPELGSQLFVEREIPPGERVLGVDGEVQLEIRQADYARATGRTQTNPLDAHAGLVRLRISALLALLEERLDVTSDDWRLAGVVLAASDVVRARAQAAVASAQEAHSRHRGERRGIEDAAAETARERRRTVERAEWIASKVWAEPDRWTRRELYNAVRSDKRGEYDEGLEHAVAEGWVVEAAEPSTSDDPKRSLRPGPTKPPRGRK